jgi:aryl-alcohol dehydrogenase-like predicted oxidoreductase
MEYQILGKSQLKISRIGFGTMSLELDNPLSGILLQKAFDEGINYFDTADMYQNGMNETVLGRALGARRKSLILATKVGNQWREDGSGWDWNPSKKYILSAIDLSLKRLQTDYIDLYQLHGGTLEDPIDDIIEAFEYLKATGKIRAYGISSIRPNVIREYVKRSSIISVMMQYSLLDRRPEESMLPFLYEQKVDVLARGSIAKGLLVSKPAESYLNYTPEQVCKISDALKSVSEKSGPFETAVQYVLGHEPVRSAVIGIRTDEQLKEALAVGGSTKLSTDQMLALGNVLPENKYIDHR